MEAVSFANEVLVLGAGVIGGVVAMLRWFRRMLRKELEERINPLHERLATIEAEVKLNGGASLKDGVYAIANHFGVRFSPVKVHVETVEIEPKEPE